MLYKGGGGNQKPEAGRDGLELSGNRSRSAEEELGSKVVTDKASTAWKYPEAMVAFRVVHIQGCTLRERHLATWEKV